jgi:CheY-like chemotaxis protein
MKKVVVAEASPTIKSVADSLLRQNGYDVVCTSDGLQAWEVISNEKPDLVLAGLSLSGISGLELCRQIASDSITGGIPVVLMIGAKDPIGEEDIISCGARGKLKKPFSPKDLLDIVNRLLGNAKEQSRQFDSSFIQNPAEQTKFSSQVSSTKHLHKKNDTINLQWLDLADNNPTKSIAKIASLDLSTDEPRLIIDDDQYGLANPLQDEEEEPQTESTKDEDYDWFIGEIKKEIEDKPSNDTRKEPDSMKMNKPAASANTPDLKFDDIISSKPFIGAPDTALTGSGTRSVKSLKSNIPSSNMKNSQAPAPQARLSNEELSLLADRVAMKLASHIASQIDRTQIIQAIKSVLNS